MKKLGSSRRRFSKPQLAVIGDESLLGELKAGLAGTGIEVAAGRKAVIEAAARPSDFVMVAIMGAAAIEPALAAIRRGVIVALANKECVVAAGAVFRATMEMSGASVLPVDSEHNAIFRGAGAAATPARPRWSPITASGVGRSANGRWRSMAAATVEQAVAHPNWAMGRKISLDSATLMNKGLELIEAHFLFALPPEKLGVVVHPQSIVHCLVSYEDGTTMAHLSAPRHAHPHRPCPGSWPRRISSPSRAARSCRAGPAGVPAARRMSCFPALNLAIGLDAFSGGAWRPPCAERRQRDRGAGLFSTAASAFSTCQQGGGRTALGKDYRP